MERYEKDGMKIDAYSWDDFIEACRKNRDYPEGSYAYAYHASVYRESEEFNGCITHDQACNLAEFGWPDGRRYMSEVDFDIDPNAKDFVVENEQRIHDVCGSIPDVPRAIAGDPCCMVEIQQSESPTKIVPILIDITTPAITSTDSIMRRGGAVVSWLDHLENKGWSTELTVRLSATHDEKKIMSQHVVVKQAGEPFDTDRLLFIMAHPAGLRRLMFHLQDLTPDSAVVGSGRGSYSTKNVTDCTFVPPLAHDIADEQHAVNELTDIMTSAIQGD